MDQIRRTVRDQLPTGAHHTRLVLSGGVVSPTDRVDFTQLSLDEIRAAVEEAEAASRYVAGHAYTARAINRALRLGVRSIEHGNLLDETSIELFKQHKAFYVPTLVTYRTLAAEGPQHGLPTDSHRKVSHVLEHGLRDLELVYRRGGEIVFGTDLLGGMHVHRAEEFTVRAEVQPPIDIIRSATCVAARLVGLEGLIGEITPGAHADLLMVEGDPLQNVTVLARPDKHLRLAMKAGQVMYLSALALLVVCRASGSRSGRSTPEPPQQSAARRTRPFHFTDVPLTGFFMRVRFQQSVWQRSCGSCSCTRAWPSPSSAEGRRA
ncbi:amidohydrolase family protein [Streptomyces sanglieri]|uniref:amidohydrolase family protein n=1 Tax=Streptomyces sanglieri TaxID=193460 RepID=UPI003524591A